MEQEYARSIDIARGKDIPRKYLEQILLILKRGGYVKSARGSSGGYHLARNPQDITLAEIVRLMDGALAPVDSVSKYFYERTPIQNEEKLLDVFREIRDYVADKLEHTTFADIAHGSTPREAP